ncbi:MAG TPA: hypothetical protein PLP23_01105 [Panacibacter sp.]|nr:hypothetical protein [Panacibacter sp.]
MVAHITSVTAQTKPKQVKLPKYKGDPGCVYKPKYSETERNKFYPFNIADTIKLVSFRNHRNNCPIKGDMVLVDSLIEIKTLTKADINNLTDLLYNNFYKQYPNYGSITQCFFPRNAILFIDKSGHLKEHILICFHCDNFEASSDKVTLGDDCSEKMEKLRQFFITSQVTFGTGRNVILYPGEESDDVIAPPIQK